MSHGQKIYYNIITAILFQIMFWYCTDYPVHIIGAELPVAVKNAVFMVLYCVFLVCIVPESKALFSHNLFYPGGKAKTVSNIIKIIVLFAAQLAIDVFYMFVSSGNNGKDMFLSTVCICIWYAAVVTVLKYRNKICFGRKKLLFSALFVLAALIFCLYRNFALFARYNILCEKFLPTSEHALRQIKNLEVICSLEQLLLSVVFGVAIVILFAYTSKEHILDDALYDCIHDRWFMRKIPATVICTSVLFWIFKILMAVIVFFVPQYTVYEVHFYEGDSTNYIFDDSFDYDVNSIEVSRCSADKTVELQFENNIVKITHSNSVLQKNIDVVRFDTDKYVVWDNYNIVDGAAVEEELSFKEYAVDDYVVYLYGNCAFCYVEDDSPKVIEFADIADSEENHVVTEMSKMLLEEGNVTAFEYVCEYLMKYDSEFIYPYISRYMESNFTEDEMLYMKVYEYSPEYVSGFAAKM